MLLGRAQLLNLVLLLLCWKDTSQITQNFVFKLTSSSVALFAEYKIVCLFFSKQIVNS